MMTSGSVVAALAGWTNANAAAAMIQWMAFMATSLFAGGGMPPHGGRILRNCYSDATAISAERMTNSCSLWLAMHDKDEATAGHHALAIPPQYLCFRLGTPS